MGERDREGGRFPNRALYLKAALVGGGAAALMSAIPVLNWLNLFFLCLVIAGGTIGARWVQARTGTVETLEGAAIGALTGLVCGALLSGLGLCVSSGFTLVVLPDLSRRESRELTTLMAVALGGSCCMSVTVYPLFGAMGGMITPLLWPPRGERDAPRPPPTGQDLVRRRNIQRVALGSLSGCLGLLGVFCGVTGYLAYLQSRGAEDTAGEPEVIGADVVVGATVELEIPASGQDHTEYGVWLVADRDLPASLYDLEGQIGCRSHSRYSDRQPLDMHPFYARPPADDHPSWSLIRAVHEYGRRGSRCRVRIDALPSGVRSARFVVTRLHEPSDWF